MAYQDLIEATTQDRYAELYKVDFGSIEYYTSFDYDVEYLGNDYRARPISRGNLNQSKDLKLLTLEIRAARIASTFMKWFGANPPAFCNLEIIRYFFDEDEDYIIFKGKVKNVTLKDYWILVQCIGPSELITTQIPKWVIKPTCNHNLFDSGCGLNSDNWDVTSTVSGISGREIVGSGLGAYADKYFQRGKIFFGTQWRMVTYSEQSTSKIWVHYPFPDLSIGNSITLWPGCVKTKDACENKFSNYDNFLGMIKVPSKNPVVWGV